MNSILAFASYAPNELLDLAHYAILLAYGILLSAAFAGLEPTKRSAISLSVVFAATGLLQFVTFSACGGPVTRALYPLIAHLPIAIHLCLCYRKRVITALAAVATAYTCCQPANWAGLIVSAITGSQTASLVFQITALAFLAYLMCRYAANELSNIYNGDTRTIARFANVPFVYYLVDNTLGIFFTEWSAAAAIVSEFLPCFICLIFLHFCVTYRRINEEKNESEQREALVSIAVEQQTQEIDQMRRNENEVRMLRHDMRWLLNTLARTLNEGDIASAQMLLSSYQAEVESTAVNRYCENNIINYVLSDFAARCQKAEVEFEPVVAIPKLDIDQMLLASLLSNALDNALKAQKGLETNRRNIKLRLKSANKRLFLSMSNPYATPPRFMDGMPLSQSEGHGYGTQSIKYLTERLGGNCQFTAKDGIFTLRVVIDL